MRKRSAPWRTRHCAAPGRGGLCPKRSCRYTRTRMTFLFGFLITLFVLILASLVYVTVAAPPAPPGAD